MNPKHRWFVLVAGNIALVVLAVGGDAWLWGQSAGMPSIVPAVGSVIYVLTLDGQQIAFDECSGLGSSHDIEQETVMTPPGSVVVKKQPGVLQWHNIRLRRRGIETPGVWQWRRMMEEGGLPQALRTSQITMYTAATAQPVAAWTFRNGWPARLVFNGEIEELVIVHEGLELTMPAGAEPRPPARR